MKHNVVLIDARTHLKTVRLMHHDGKQVILVAQPKVSESYATSSQRSMNAVKVVCGNNHSRSLAWSDFKDGNLDCAHGNCDSTYHKL